MVRESMTLLEMDLNGKRINDVAKNGLRMGRESMTLLEMDLEWEENQ